jgi:hypothetical protein
MEPVGPRIDEGRHVVAVHNTFSNVRSPWISVRASNGSILASTGSDHRGEVVRDVGLDVIGASVPSSGATGSRFWSEVQEVRRLVRSSPSPSGIGVACLEHECELADGVSSLCT